MNHRSYKIQNLSLPHDEDSGTKLVPSQNNSKLKYDIPKFDKNGKIHKYDIYNSADINTKEDSKHVQRLYDETDYYATISKQKLQYYDHFSKKQLQNELKHTKKLLEEKELTLKDAMSTNKKLKEKIRSLNNVNTELKEVKEQLLNLLENYNSEKSISINLSNISEIVNSVKKLVQQLEEDKRKIEKKYKKLFELHNMQIEVNSKIHRDRTLRTIKKSEFSNL